MSYFLCRIVSSYFPISVGLSYYSKSSLSTSAFTLIHPASRHYSFPKELISLSRNVQLNHVSKALKLKKLKSNTKDLKSAQIRVWIKKWIIFLSHFLNHLNHFCIYFGCCFSAEAYTKIKCFIIVSVNCNLLYIKKNCLQWIDCMTVLFCIIIIIVGNIVITFGVPSLISFIDNFGFGDTSYLPLGFVCHTDLTTL